MFGGILMVRYGKVSQVNKEKQTVQVLFEDLDQTTSNDLPIIYPHTIKNRVVKLPEINEEVVCIFSEGGSDGWCVGSYANYSMIPGTLERFEFEDGTVLEYDTVAHHLLANIKGTATLKGENIILNGATTLDGDVTFKGTVTIEGDIVVKGTMTSQGKATFSNGATIDGTATIQNALISGSMSMNGSVSCPDKCTCTG